MAARKQKDAQKDGGRGQVRVRRRAVQDKCGRGLRLRLRPEAEGSGLQGFRDRGVDEGRGVQVDVDMWNSGWAAAARGGVAAAAPGDD